MHAHTRSTDTTFTTQRKGLIRAHVTKVATNAQHINTPRYLPNPKLNLDYLLGLAGLEADV